MKTFVQIMEALKVGHKIRHSKWEPITKGFVVGGDFFCQRGEAEPYPYDLSYRELNEKKWSVV